MRVDGGRKLTKAELNDAQGCTGHLEIEPGCAYLRAHPDSPHTLVPCLFDPHVRWWRGDEGVVTGRVNIPGTANDSWPQAWWFRLSTQSDSQ